MVEEGGWGVGEGVQLPQRTFNVERGRSIQVCQKGNERDDDFVYVHT